MISDLFEQYKNTPADINEHLETMFNLCVEHDVKTVVELGVRGGMSTAAFLHAMDQTEGMLYSYDINQHTCHPEITLHSRWRFTRGNDTDPNVVRQVPDCDLLFIDTSHAYDHTLFELRTYAPKAKKLVVLHDTQLEQPEAVGPQPPYPVRKAVLEYLQENPGVWDFKEYLHNYGLGILYRKDTA